MKTTPDINERISALLDGESADPGEDNALLQGNVFLEEQQRQYREIGRLMRALPAPDPSEHFVEAVLARLPKKKQRNIVRMTFTFAAAAALLLAFSVFIFRITPNPIPTQSGDTPLPIAVNNASLVYLDVPEDTLIFLQIESVEDNELEKTLALFEAIPEDRLIIALAEMTLEEEAQYYATTEDVLAPPVSWSMWPTASSSFADVFLLLETLDDAEAAVLNTLLRDALATT